MATTHDQEIALRNALINKDLEAVKIILKSGINPNIKLPNESSILDITLGNTKIPAQIEATKILIADGADYKGIGNTKLSHDQKLELNKIRENYLQEGKECFNNLKSSFPASVKQVTPIEFFTALSNQTLGQDVFPKEIATQMLELYNSCNQELQQQIQNNINKAISILHDKSYSFRTVDTIKSLGGLRYHEPSPSKEVHMLVRNIVLSLSDNLPEQSLSGQIDSEALEFNQ